MKLLGVLLLLVSHTLLASANTQSLPLMPYPQSLQQGEKTLQLSDNIAFEIAGMSEQRALFLLPYYQQQFADAGFTLSSENAQTTLIKIIVNQGHTVKFQLPQLHQDESYQLTITEQGIEIVAATDFGAIQGLATLNQLFYFAKESKQLPTLVINDMPRFPWRGFMLDSVRHFISLAAVKRQIDGMAAAKLNVFHWHLTDDQGWRIESITHPKLHQVAADGQFYSQAEIKEVVAYAAKLGIRVVPEFDVPGHASAIAVAYPELITEVKRYDMEDGWGVFEPLLDPSKPEVYQFVDAIVMELTQLFPDSYLHIGGDEVHPTQWNNSENVQTFMQANSLTDAHDIQVYFNAKVQKILAKHQRQMMGWDEIYHPDLPKDIMVQSWRGMESLSQIATDGFQGLLSTGFYIDQPQASAFHYRNEPLTQRPNSAVELAEGDQLQAWQFTMPRLKGSAVKGQLVVISRNNYAIHAYVKLNNNHFKKARLDRQLALNSHDINFTIDSWMGPTRGEFSLDSENGFSGRMLIGNAYYPVEAQPIEQFDYQTVKLLPNMTAAAEKNVLGGEATLWTELVTEENLDLRTWPRMFVIAERFWSAKSKNNPDDMYRRLIEVNNYAEHIGLRHLEQYQQGMQSLAFVKSDIAPLLIFAEQLEPASYYTRHHIKFQQDLYHQNAPLKRFADYLPVESLTLVQMQLALKQFKAGDKLALQQVIDVLRRWHYNFDSVLSLIKQAPKLTELKQLAVDARTINTLGLTIAQSCLAGVKINGNESARIKSRLHQIHAKGGEVVIGAGLFTEQLLDVCRK